MSELSCAEFVELVTEFLDGVLPAAESARIRAHLAGCTGCEAYLDQMRTTVRLLGSTPEVRASAAAEARAADVFRQWSRQRSGG